MFNVTNELENRKKKKNCVLITLIIRLIVFSELMMKVANERAISIPSYLS